MTSGIRLIDSGVICVAIAVTLIADAGAHSDVHPQWNACVGRERLGRRAHHRLHLT